MLVDVTGQGRERRPSHRRGCEKEFLASFKTTVNESNIENDRHLKSRISVLCAILELALNPDDSYGVRCLRCFTID